MNDSLSALVSFIQSGELVWRNDFLRCDRSLDIRCEDCPVNRPEDCSDWRDSPEVLDYLSTNHPEFFL